MKDPFALINWFWTIGHQRQGRYALGLGSWLDNAYSLLSADQRLEAAQVLPRPCVALWGPSQAGKSTLLSRYFDSCLVSDGRVLHSALQWSPDEPVVFLGRKDTPRGCVQLNPYNLGSDASGCVSRFILMDSIENPAHPVRLLLCNEHQLLHSLAIGFLSECNQQVGNAKQTFFDSMSIDELLDRYAVMPGQALNRSAYEELRTVADILEDLTAAEWSRYSNLRPVWNTLRTRILGHPTLASSLDLVDKFAADLFWDGEKNISDLFQQLRQMLKRIRNLAGTKSIHCSYRVAKLFLDISSYKKYVTNPDQNVLDVRYSANESQLFIDYEAPNYLFSTPSDFGLWQGLAWELVFSVNATTLSQTAPKAADFLAGTDLLDFPGVAIAMPGGVKKIASQMTPDELLTEVLKRGKTASVVAHKAREFNIYGFCLLIRMSTPAAQPNQLIHGIKAWLSALHLPMPPASRDVPLNLVLTFAASVVNAQVFALRNNRPSNNLEDVFSWLDQIGPLATPTWSNYFAVTYPHLPAARIEGKREELQIALKDISEDVAFTSRFGQNSESLTAMFRGGEAPDGDGGVDYLLDKLIEQVHQSRMPQLLEQRKRDIQHQIQTLLNEALPLDNAENRKAELLNWKNAIQEAIRKFRAEEPEGDASMRVSLFLRKIVSVDPQLLESLPLQCANTNVTAYIDRQFNAQWLQSRRFNLNEWSLIGLTDQSLTQRLLGYLCECAIQDGSFAKWIRNELGQITHHADADYARRFLATKMQDTLCFGTSGRKLHRQFAAVNGGLDGESIESRLQDYNTSEALLNLDRKDENSPHYKGFISGFIEHLDKIANTAIGGRPPQKGDDELRRLRSEIQSMNAMP